MMRILLLFICLLEVTYGADDAPSSKAMISQEDRSHFMPQDPGIDISPEASASYQKALIAYYEYKERGYNHRSRVYIWQHVSTISIFISVLVIVFIGLYFSYLQFSTAIVKNRRRKASEPDAEAPTTFKASLSGVEVTSNVIGLVILTLSIVFFYLYLVHVYPIKDAL